MTAALITLAAIVDLAFCGFRAAAGRNARIFKRAYYRRAMLEGVAAGVVLALVLGAATVVAVVAQGEVVYADLTAIGLRMLPVFGVYAALVLGALGLYLVARHELRTLATVAILGPFTMLRPLVIAGAMLAGLTRGGGLAALSLTIAACACEMATGVWLDRRYAGRPLDA